MAILISILAYLLSVFVSWKYCAGYWVVGPVFAAAILMAHFKQVGKKFSLRHVAWILASTLVYALVYWISRKGWAFQQDWLDMLAGSLTAGVIAGSLLMPAIHAYLFDVPSKSARKASLLLILSWYVTIFLSLLDEKLGFKPHIEYDFVAIALWQGIYFRTLRIK